jgi:hypothetical protein
VSGLTYELQQCVHNWNCVVVAQLGPVVALVVARLEVALVVVVAGPGVGVVALVVARLGVALVVVVTGPGCCRKKCGGDSRASSAACNLEDTDPPS